MRSASTWIGRIDLKRRPQVWRIDFSRPEAKTPGQDIQCRQRLRFSPKIGESRGGDREAPEAAVWKRRKLRVNSHQLLWLCVGKRGEKDSIDGAKNGRIRADAQPEGEHRHSGEAGVLQQLAEGEFEVVHGS